MLLHVSRLCRRCDIPSSHRILHPAVSLASACRFGVVLGALLVVLGERAQFDMRTVPQLGAAAPPCTPAHEARESQGARAPAKRKSAVRALALAVAVQGLVQK